MKELTIGQKAQRYDEAIKKLRDFYRDYDTVSLLIDVKEELANLLPELKESEESEDERIRKNCIHFLELQKQHHAATFEIEECIAWLEKQGEQKPAELGEEDEETFGYLEDIVSFCYRNQYVVNVQTCEKVRQLVFRLKSLCFQSGWGKDDITRINEIIETLNIVQANRVRTQRMHYNKATIDKNIDWLKSLKDRVHPQPKQEWSKEDEKMIENIIDTINMSIEDCDVDDIGTKARFSLEKERDWLKNKLKSLRPQTRWKPSEEQMDAVKSAALDVAKFSSRSEQLRLENEPYYKALMSLYNDLEKLRG